VREDAAKQLFRDAMLAQVLRHCRVFISPKTVQALGLASSTRAP